MLKHTGLLFVTVVGIALATTAAHAGEGGSSHVLPGATATLVDLPPAKPGTFFKPMYAHYDASAPVAVPTAAGIVADLKATVDTIAIGGGHTFESTVLGGAHYTAAVFVPYVEIDLSGEVQLPGGRLVSKDTNVTDFGDMTVVPIMLAWKTGEWQFDTMLPIYAPTGSYKDGRLGNPSLNYWTFDPNVGVAYSGKESGFNGMLRAGYAINTENNATEYESGSILHIEAAVEQMIPAGAGFVALGAEGFYFDQLTCDSGNGATLGCFEGETAGLGPVLGYILPLGAQSLALEVKWLKELDTTNRLEGDYTWLKAVYKF
jgi:hypothetical protein